MSNHQHTLIIDGTSGISGDMTVAALLDLGASEEHLRDQLATLPVGGFEIAVTRVNKHGIDACDFDVQLAEELENHDHDMVWLYGNEAGTEHTHEHEHYHHDHGEHEHEHCHEHDHEAHGHGHEGHHHAHHHHHRSLADVTAIIDDSQLSDGAKRRALAIFTALAAAEAKAHGCPVGDVHFHEVGALDAVADVTAVCLLMEWLGADRVAASPVNLGGGQVKCAHGVLPVPAPATAWLVRDIPCYGGDVQTELCTPTGAALLRTFASSFGPMPAMTVKAVGVGAGNKDFAAANVVRAFLGETGESGASDQVVELACNLDDMTGEAIAYAAGVLLAAGALDVYTEAIQMKKNRPAVKLCCLCRPADAERLSQLMLAHTTSWGVRRCAMERVVQPRECRRVETPYGPVDVKFAPGAQGKAKAEFDQAAAAAAAAGVPLETVLEAARRAFEKR